MVVKFSKGLNVNKVASLGADSHASVNESEHNSSYKTDNPSLISSSLNNMSASMYSQDYVRSSNQKH